MHPNFHHQDWLPRIPGNTVARGLGNEGEQRQAWEGQAGGDLACSNTQCNGKREEDRLPQPGGQGLLLEEMVLEPVRKDGQEFESRKGPQAKGQHRSKRLWHLSMQVAQHGWSLGSACGSGKR